MAGGSLAVALEGGDVRFGSRGPGVGRLMKQYGSMAILWQ
jgi:hypothetical protein